MRSVPIIIAALALPAGAQAQETAHAPADEAIQDCSAHKFETFVERVVDGEPRKSRVRLCGKTGQSDAEWIATLEDAIAKVRENIEMPPDARSQIIAAVSAEIARLRDPAATASVKPAPVLTPRAAPRPRDLRDDYASLPAIPPPAPAQPAAPLTATPPPVAGNGATASTAPIRARPVETAPSLVAPSLAFDCYVAGELGGPAPCIEFQRDTLITVRARSDVPAGIELHFERNGSDRAKVAIGPMKSGGTKRLPLPSGVCQGVGDGRLAIAIWNGPRPARTEGPFPLRCS
jgi:hypothetical protein